MNGNFTSLGDKLRKEIELIDGLPGEKFNYPDVWLDEEDIEIVANLMLKRLDIIDWKVVERSSDKSTFGVYKPKKEIRIGKNTKRRMEEVLPVIAHEIEGHVMNAVSENKAGYTPKVMEVYSAGGRDEVLSKMMGRWVEDETRKLMGIEAKIPESLYFKTLKKKKNGATFAECFDFYFREYVKKQNYEFEKIMEDREVYERCFDNVYDRVMRLFRKNSPLSERSGCLSTTDQLKYVEQYLVLKKLTDLDLENLMFLDGADLYSTKQIKELGLLEEVESLRSKFVLAKDIWPVIKKGLNDGKGIKDILAEMKMG